MGAPRGGERPCTRPLAISPSVSFALAGYPLPFPSSEFRLATVFPSPLLSLPPFRPLSFVLLFSLLKGSTFKRLLFVLLFFPTSINRDINFSALCLSVIPPFDFRHDTNAIFFNDFFSAGCNIFQGGGGASVSARNLAKTDRTD